MSIADFMAHMDKKSIAETQKNELFNRKRGMFTASEFVNLMTYEEKGVHLSKGGMEYAKIKAVQMLTKPDDANQGFTSSAMQWGLDNELAAIERLEEKLGVVFDFKGTNQEFISLNDDVGCTPDARNDFIKEGVEAKCPNSTTHYDYCCLLNREDIKKKCAKYYWQVQGQMLVTGFIKWHFISFDPRYPVKEHQLKHLVIHRHESDIEHLKARLDLAIEYRDKCIDEFLRAMS